MIDFLYSRVCKYSLLAIDGRYKIQNNSNELTGSCSVINCVTNEIVCSGSLELCTSVLTELDKSAKHGITIAARKASKYFV